jgi:predicted DNA-binding ribbon-helix-helix protein
MKKGPRNLRLEQIKRLEEIAEERACTVAEVIREAVDMLIESYDLADAKRTRV